MSGIFSSLTEGDLKRIAAVLLLIVFNAVFAVIGALMRGGFNPAAGGFDAKKFPEFFYKQILPFVVGLAFFEAFLHLQPPSGLVSALVGADSVIVVGEELSPSSPWAWLDPTVLWTVYGSIIVMLVRQLSANLIYVFGKGLTLAQSKAQ